MALGISENPKFWKGCRVSKNPTRTDFITVLYYYLRHSITMDITELYKGLYLDTPHSRKGHASDGPDDSL